MDHAKGVMYVVGGSGTSRYGDVYKFKFDELAWSKLLTTGYDLNDGRYKIHLSSGASSDMSSEGNI